MDNNNICCCLCALYCYEPDSENRDRSGESCSCFDSYHAKTIEIILIAGFSGSSISFLLSIVVGE